MADSSLRSLERAAASDPLAAARLIEARIRAGGRDPRRDPEAGDWLVGDTRRAVNKTWPRVVAPDELGRMTVVARPMHSGADWPRPDVQDLRVGDEVLSVEPYEIHSTGETVLTWHVQARRYHDDEWTSLLTYSRPATRESKLLPVEAVEWEWLEARRTSLPQRSTIGAWRRWAKRATVERVG